MYPVFYTNRLRKYANNLLPRQAAKEPSGEIINGELEYKVKAILTLRLTRRRLEYRI